MCGRLSLKLFFLLSALLLFTFSVYGQPAESEQMVQIPLSSWIELQEKVNLLETQLTESEDTSTTSVTQYKELMTDYNQLAEHWLILNPSLQELTAQMESNRKTEVANLFVGFGFGAAAGVLGTIIIALVNGIAVH